MLLPKTFAILVVTLLAHASLASTVTSGNISLEVETGSQLQEYNTQLFSEVNDQIILTQSSKIKIQTKVVKNQHR